MYNAGVSATFHHYYGDKILFALAALSCVFLFVMSKDDRRRLAWPMLFCFLAVLNPYAYKAAASIGVYWYWRLFWMFAEAVVTALAVTRGIGLMRKSFDWPIPFITACIVIGLAGNYIFQDTAFNKARNPDKLKSGTEEVCEALLAVDPNPRVILCYAYTPYARQYSGDIILYNDRYAFEYPEPAREHLISREFEKESPDYWLIFEEARSKGFNFVVPYGNRPVPEEVRAAYGYQEVCDVAGVVIFYNPEV